MATKKTAAENAEVKEEKTQKAAAPKASAKKAAKPAAEKKYVSRVQEQYEKEVVPALTAKFG